MKSCAHPIKAVLLTLGALAAAFALALAAANLTVILSVQERVLSAEDAAGLEDIDCILVLGCGVNELGVPSPLLRGRLTTGLELYTSGAAPKLLMSGDHGRNGYDEVNAMKDWAVERGARSADVFMDHAGFSTYESVYRARDVFQARRVIIVTQRYHLSRALYIAERMGLEAWGVASQGGDLPGQLRRDVRELAARGKDCLWCILRPQPTYLGDAIPVSGNGDVTNDR